MQVLRMTGACNNRCRFCMVSREIEQGQQPRFDELSSLLASLPAGERVDFFGGEPTLYPGFWELLEFSAAQGHQISLATNGRYFSLPEAAERIAKFPVAMRSSLYGDDAALHDFLTQVPDSFAETCAGLKNLSERGCKVLVNIVMLQENMDRLSAITQVLAACGVRRVKYSMLIDGWNFLPSIAPIDGLRASLWDAIEVALAEGMYFVLEKSPYCLLPAFLTQCHPESDPKMISSSSKLYAKADICADCIGRDHCLGVEKSYLAKYGERGLAPMKTWPSHMIQNLAPADLACYRPRYPTNLIRLHLPETAAGICGAGLEQQWAQLQEQYPGCCLIRTI